MQSFKKKEYFGPLPAYIFPVDKNKDNSDFMAFLDIRPLDEGHLLVIPVKHYDTVWDMPSAYVRDYFEYCVKAANKLKAKLKTTREQPVNAMVLGYEVPHACVHLIPNIHNGFGARLGNILYELRTRNKAKALSDPKNAISIAGKLGIDYGNAA